MMRWVLLLLLGLNIAYLGFSLHRAHEYEVDPYAGIVPLERFPEAVEIRLIDSLQDSPATEARGQGGLPRDP
jgi:hypothetical protein